MAQKLEETQDILGASEQELAVVSKRAAEFERTVASRAAEKEADLARAKADKADAEAVLRGLRAELVTKSTTIAAMDKHTRDKSAEIVELKSQLDGKKAKAWILEQDLKERQIAHAARWKAWLDGGGQATCNVGISLRLPGAVSSAEFTAAKNKVKGALSIKIAAARRWLSLLASLASEYEYEPLWGSFGICGICIHHVGW